MQQDRRKEPREHLAMPAKLSRLSHDLSGIVRDLSTAGCKIEVAGLQLEPGNRVLIRPRGFESLLGDVIWSKDGQAGIQFDEALDTTQVGLFCRLYPDPATAIMLDVAA